MPSLTCPNSPYARLSGFAALVLVIAAAPGCNRGNKAENATSAAAVSTEANLQPGSGPTLPPQPPTNDPAEILRHMVAAYKAINSMQVSASNDQRLRSTRTIETHQEVVTTFQKTPARISRVLVDRLSGSHRAYADGVNLVNYSGLANTFVRKEARGDLAALCRILDSDVVQLVSVTTLLASGDMPAGMESPKLMGREDVKGKSAYVIQAKYGPAFMKDLAVRLKMGKDVTPHEGAVMVWIDPDTWFLIKSETKLGWTVKPPGQQEAMNLEVEYNQRVNKTVVNPSVTESTFTFVAPPRAQEIFPNRDKPAG